MVFTRAVTDSAGAVLAQTRYTEFGEVRSDIGTVIQTDFGYTFQRNIADMGLMDYKARFRDLCVPERFLRVGYSNLLGRFVQPDTLVPGAGNPQMFNRYAYATNNPIKYIDPSGHGVTDGCAPDSSDCVNLENVSSGSSGGGNNVSISTFSINSNNTLSEGTIYTNSWVIPYHKWRDSSLSTKAEESYTGIGSAPSINYSAVTNTVRVVEGFQTGMSIMEDFATNIYSDPIGIELDWKNTENGLLIENITVKNYARVALMVDNVLITGNSAAPIVISGENYAIGVNGNKPGILNLGVKTVLSSSQNSLVKINFLIAGGYPRRFSKTFIFPNNVLLDPGCSYIQ